MVHVTAEQFVRPVGTLVLLPGAESWLENLGVAPTCERGVGWACA